MVEVEWGVLSAAEISNKYSSKESDRRREIISYSYLIEGNILVNVPVKRKED